MSLAEYWKGAVWEFLLSLIASMALLYTVLNGFYVDSGLQHGPIPAVACLVSLAALFAIAYNKTTLRIGALAYAIVVLGILGACVSLSPDIMVDSETNYLIFALCAILVPLVVFALGRTRTTAALLFVIGIFIVVFIQFFYERYELVWALAFIFSSLALVVYKNYQRSVETVRSVKKASFGSGFAVAAGSVAAALALGCGIWFVIIAPFNPPAVDIKLITEEHALETKQVKGVADFFLTPDLDKTSSHTNDEERTTDDLKLEDDGRVVLANGKSAGDPEEEEQAGSTFMGMNLDSLKEVFDYQRYNEDDWARLALVLALIIAAWVAYFVGRRRLRAMRLAKILKSEPGEQAKSLYLFLMERFERLGFKIPPGQTVAEYAAGTEIARKCFDEGAGVPFAKLTDDYVRLTYSSDKQLAQERADDFARYYKSFWKSSRTYLGNVKYFFKSFRL